jgi:hypothetical protein
MQKYVSAGHLARARDTLDQLDRDFQVNYVEDLELKDIAVQRPSGNAATAEPVYAYLAFVARDWIEDLRTGEVIEGDAGEQQAFLERWTFVSEGRRGWVVDNVESVWSGSQEQAASQAWPGLPAGFYSRRNRPSAWRQWDGSSWVATG